MIVEKNKVVSLSYELKVEGETVETVGVDSPLMFLFDSGNLLPKFEKNLNGLKLDDGFDFNLVSADAYGPKAEDAIVDVPLEAFTVDGEIDSEILKVGNHIPMLDQSGNRLNGVVVKFNDEFVTMDFNHPLAGNDLHFSGKVVEIREASADELEHGHVHSPESCKDCTDADCHSKSH
ncbi:MAG: peptidylprolyl isomerase [Bacteroidales bacterium]|nr:peptidylprolyl isomerase [Bacteroidales bacterium]